MIALERFGHVALAVADLERALAFYRDLLGLVVSDHTEIPEHPEVARGAFLRLPNGSDHHCLALFEMKQPLEGWAAPGAGSIGLHHFAFAVRDYEGLLDAYRTLRLSGVEIVGQRQYGPGSQLRLYCLDPDGNRVEIYWDLDQIGWDGRARPVLPIEEVSLEEHDLEDYLARKREAGVDGRSPRPGVRRPSADPTEER